MVEVTAASVVDRASLRLQKRGVNGAKFWPDGADPHAHVDVPAIM
jgi:hypothetical protein